MKRYAILCLLMAAPAMVVLAADEKPTGPDGVYKVTGLSKGGEKAPAEVTKTFESVTIKGDKFTMKLAGDSKVATVKIDAKAKPATIDITPDDGPEKGKTMKGIWKMEKDVLTIALVEGDKGDSKRPENFEGKGQSDIILELTKEEKKDK